MAENKERLFDQFPEVSYAEWRAKVEADLKGADFNKKLVWRTNEGFDVQPVYRAEDIADFKTTDSLPGQYPYVRGTRTDNDWLTRQNIIADSAEEANKTALDVLTKGVTSLGFKVGDAADVATLLKDIDLGKVEINLTCCPGKVVEVAKALVAAVAAAGATDTFRGSIDYNPLRRQFRHGVEGVDSAAITATAAELLDVVAPVAGLRCLSVDSDILANAGAFIYQESGYALAWGAQWMTLLTEAGRSADEVAMRIKFNMCVSSNFFMEIAKFRAARMLWAQIVEQYGASEAAAKMMVNASTSRFNQTIYDAHVNLLRSQTETFSACVGGVDSIVTTPFDTPYKTPDAFSERIARNQQLLLKEESHFDKVVDPSAGSYYIEELTHSLADVAWRQFLKIEEEGGFLAAVKAGTVQDDINATNDKRHADAAKRKEFILGTNQFPNFTETAEGKEPLTCSCCCGHKEEAPFKSINSTRMAADFEQLRLATEKSGKTPVAFMLTIGNLAWRQARAQFSSNFLACAGYKIIDNLGFDTVEEGVDAALKAGADIVVLCSSDDEYATYSVPAFNYLANRAMFIVAGAPACMDELKAAGIENFVHVKCNVLETLKEYNGKLGI